MHNVRGPPATLKPSQPKIGATDRTANLLPDPILAKPQQKSKKFALDGQSLLVMPVAGHALLDLHFISAHVAISVQLPLGWMLVVRYR